MTTTYVDAEGLVADWVNRSANLVGDGRPLAKGAHLAARLTGALSACYALLDQVGGGTAGGAENPDQRARISVQIYGPTKAAAAAAAAAYADQLAGFTRPWTNANGTILSVDDTSIAGPTWVPDVDEPRYLVDADFYVRPA
jgi:hypothetical protein